MKSKLWLCILLGFASLVSAHAQAPIPPLPAGPLLNNAPVFSQWLISVTSEPVDITKNVKPRKYDQRSQVRKTGSIRDEITININSGTSESWFKDGFQAKIVPGVKEPLVILPGANTLSDPYEDYSKTDFHGFEWISRSNYAGIRNIFGVDCIIFHIGPAENSTAQGASASPAASTAAAAAPQETGTTACIAGDSRLPVLLKEENATTFYEFQPPPSAMLAIPPNIQAAMDAVRDAILRATAKPAAP